MLFAGRLYRRKRVDTLLRAAAMLRGRIPGLEVRIVGRRPVRRAARAAWRASCSLETRVTWLGDVSRPQLAAEYNRADVFCLPSVQEGFGIVLLEAMAAGKPIVASRAAAIPEVAPHGLLVEPENPEALAAAIETLYRSPEQRAALGAEGLRRVEPFDAPRRGAPVSGRRSGRPRQPYLKFSVMRKGTPDWVLRRGVHHVDALHAGGLREHPGSPLKHSRAEGIGVRGVHGRLVFPGEQGVDHPAPRLIHPDLRRLRRREALHPALQQARGSAGLDDRKDSRCSWG